MGQQQLDRKAIWLFFIRSYLGWVFVALFLNSQLLLFFEEIDFQQVGFFWWFGTIFVVPLVIAWVYGKLAHYFYRYELTDEGFRKEHGIIWKKYTTIPYERIQNVDIRRGIVARLLGLSDLHVQTAGASAMYSGSWSMGTGAEGSLPGVSRDVAEQLRSELVRRAKAARSSGV